MTRDPGGPGLEGAFYHYLHNAEQADPQFNSQVLEAYLPCFAGRRNVLELGCGQGQFLELLQQQGLRGIGIDSDGEMIAVCRGKGLDVVQADVFDYLGEHARQFDAIFCSNVIEHLTAQEVLRLLGLVRSALDYGGVFVVATPNPESLIVQTHEFWRDATHVRPYSRHLLEFLLDYAGFVEISSGENLRTAWTLPDELQAVADALGVAPVSGLGSAELIVGDRSSRYLESLRKKESVWTAGDSQSDMPAGLRRQVVALRRRIARFLARDIMYEEFLTVEARLSSLVGLSRIQLGLLLKPREIYAVGYVVEGDGAHAQESSARDGQEIPLGESLIERGAPQVGAPDDSPGPGQAGRLRIAFFTPYVPYPPDTGGKIRSYHLMRALAQRHDVDLFAISHGDASSDQIEPLRGLCRRVLVHHVDKSARTRDRIWRALFRLPRSVDYFTTEKSLKFAERELQRERYDLVIADEIVMAPYAALAPELPLLIIRQKVDYIHYAEMARARPVGVDKVLDTAEAVKLKRYERENMPFFQAYVACSQLDVDLFGENGAADIPHLVIPNGVDLATFRPRDNRRDAPPTSDPSPERPTLLYVGAMSYYPNVDAVRYFFDTMCGPIRQAVPGLRIRIVGHAPPPEIQGLARLPGVEVTGSVPDMRPYYSGATCLIVPLRLGGGTRLKIVEAMAMGLPVVTTSVGAQGLDVHHGEDVMLADDPPAFVRSVLELISNAALRERLATGGQRLAQRYDWTTLTQPFVNLCEQVALEHGSSRNPATAGGIFDSRRDSLRSPRH